MAARILSVATALPSHRLEPGTAIQELRRFWPQLARLDGVESELGTRYVCEPIEELLKPRGLRDLSTAYLEHARRLAAEAAQGALARSGLRGNDIDLVITVSCTGYLVPSLDVHLAPQLGFRPDVLRLPITELGCSGGAAAIGFAHRHLCAFPDHKVLVIAVELSSLNFHPADPSLDNLTATLVFGDGAGAAVLSGPTPGGSGLEVLRTASHLVPDSAGLLGFDLVDDGFRVVLDRRLPRRLAPELQRLVAEFLGDADPRELGFLAAHAAGPRIFDTIATALGASEDSLDACRQVFKDVGNTSSAAILFTLERLLAGFGERPSRGLGIGIGPGISVELLELAWSPSEDARDEAGSAGERSSVLGRSVEQALFPADAVEQHDRVES